MKSKIAKKTRQNEEGQKFHSFRINRSKKLVKSTFVEIRTKNLHLRLRISRMAQALRSSSLYLRYLGETDFNKILNQLREAQNVEEIEFGSDGVGEQDNENICQIIKKILGQPDLKKITWIMEDSGEFNGMEIDGEFPQVIY